MQITTLQKYKKELKVGGMCAKYFFVECGGRKLVEVEGSIVWVGCAWLLWSKAECVCGAKK